MSDISPLTTRDTADNTSAPLARPHHRHVIHDEPTRRTSVIAGTLGNLVEWFDWSVYGFFVPVFAPLFFPESDPTAQLLSALAVFAVGFFMRPLGGAVIGSFADRHGRHAGMTVTISLMALASLMIALAPTYSRVGVLSPAILVLARCLQGFSAGGEFGTSSAFLVENAPDGRRASVGMWQQVSVGGGTLIASALASAVFSFLPPEAVAAWGWRLAFALGALGGLVGLYIRLRVPDTAISSHIRSRGSAPRQPLLTVFTHYPVAAVRVAGIVALGTALVQFWFVNLPTLIHARDTSLPLKDAQLAATIGLSVFTVLLPLSGRLSDRYGRRPMLLAFALGTLVICVPLLATVQPTFLSIALLASAGGVFCAAYAGSLAAVMAEQFPSEVRNAGISLPYGISVAIFGGCTPLVATTLQASGHFTVFLILLALGCLASIWLFWHMPETHNRPLSTGDIDG